MPNTYVPGENPLRAPGTNGYRGSPDHAGWSSSGLPVICPSANSCRRYTTSPTVDTCLQVSPWWVSRDGWADQDFARGLRSSPGARAHSLFARTSGRNSHWGFRFVAGEFTDDRAFDQLATTLHDLDRVRGTGGNHAFYLSIPPRFFSVVVEQLRRSGLSADEGGAWRRVIVEKPFGHDLESAQELNSVLGEVFPSGSVPDRSPTRRGETVQNLLALRFANTLWEPIWNNHFIDHADHDGRGHRHRLAGRLLRRYRSRQGRDPEPPPAVAGPDRDGGAAVLSPSRAVRLEKEKVLSSVVLPDDLDRHTARGQYLAGWQGESRSRDSSTRTTSWRPPPPRPMPRSNSRSIPVVGWGAVLSACRQTPGSAGLGDRGGLQACPPLAVPEDRHRGTLLKRVGHPVQPDGVSIKFGSKVPGTQMEVRDVTMDFAYGDSFTENSPEAYERLILDVLLGDAPLFPTPRGGRDVLGDPRSDPGQLGVPRKAGGYPPRTWGPVSPMRCLPVTAAPGGDHDPST